MPSDVQLVGHVGLTPLQRYGEQLGLPALPEGLFAHPPVEQVPHAPQAELQQMPLTQKPDEHWVGVVHEEPLGRVEPHFPETQLFPLAQPPFEVQLAGHPVAVPSQTYGAQEGLPAPPAATAVQVPVEQVPQGPHPESQQMPPTQ